MLSIDEKSQIQALDRTQPGLPIKPGRWQTMTHAAALTSTGKGTVYNFTRESLGTPKEEAHIKDPKMRQKLRAAASRPAAQFGGIGR